jgi:hypothetical protein
MARNETVREFLDVSEMAPKIAKVVLETVRQPGMADVAIVRSAVTAPYSLQIA